MELPYLILLAVIVYQGVEKYIWYRDKARETKDLLNRIMATDFTQYTTMTNRTIEALEKAGAKVEVIPIADLERRMAESGIVL